MDLNRLLYIGIELDEKSKRELFSYGRYFLNIYSRDFEPRYFCHHMTVAFKTNVDEDIIKYFDENEGKEFSITVETIGISNKACAAKVTCNVPCKSKYKHITIATNTLSNGKPVDSNDIVDFKKMRGPIVLNGTLKAFYKN